MNEMCWICGKPLGDEDGHTVDEYYLAHGDCCPTCREEAKRRAWDSRDSGRQCQMVTANGSDGMLACRFRAGHPGYHDDCYDPPPREGREWVTRDVLEARPNPYIDFRNQV